jgi:2-oxoglutarate dehydrogenase E2 component (dihydrolipoamide succinyltransferase)
MAIELKIPEIGESITEVEIGGWLKAQGQVVAKDEPVVTLESEKATVELPAPDSGTIARILKEKGATAKVGEVIGFLEKQGEQTQPKSQQSDQPAPELRLRREQEQSTVLFRRVQPPPEAKAEEKKPEELRVMPSAKRALAERGLRAEQIEPTGPGGRLLKEDVLGKSVTPEPESTPLPRIEREPLSQASTTISTRSDRQEEIVPMNRLRRTVAERLVEAQNTAALLTTFNEVDMTNVLALRKQYGEQFQQRYNVKLGFMSFFVKACIEALKQFPAVNAEVRGTDIVYHNYFDIGVAIGGGKGLVVPVLRNAERMSFAEIEVTIGDFARRAKENKLKIEELRGGTFTISNGGVYGSLLSTPIINPPQSGVLGMHSIQERPVAHEGNVAIRPMMYLALTYDHRIVDGREGVTFLKRVKDVIESPARMLMEI